MKEIKTFNSYNNGPVSRMNIHFTDGTQFSRRISARDAVRIAKEGKAVLEEMMQKYAAPDTKPTYRNISADDERFFWLRHKRGISPLPEEEEREYRRLLNMEDCSI